MSLVADLSGTTIETWVSKVMDNPALIAAMRCYVLSKSQAET